MNFNKERFANFAKYDLAINKKFYRNLSLVTIFGALGITVFGFMIRWVMWRPYAITDMSGIEDAYNIMDDGYAIYTWDCSGTSAFLYGFLALMLTLFCGCWAHNLRTRQGRIMELTMPASNIERFLWHALLMVGGGLLLVILSALLADGANALLCLGAMPDGIDVPSLIASGFDIVSFKMIDEYGDGAEHIRIVCIALCLSSFLLQMAFYMYGNSLKYRFNLILTYIAEQIISFVLSITLVIVGTSIHTSQSISMSTDDAETMFECVLYGISAIEIILAATFVWLSHRNYVKAQLITPLNK